MPKKRSKSPKRPKAKKKSPSSSKKRSKSKSRATEGASQPSKQSVSIAIATQVSEGSLENILSQLGGHNRRNSYNARTNEIRGRSLYRSERNIKSQPLDQANNQKSSRSISSNDMDPVADQSHKKKRSDRISDDDMRDVWQNTTPYKKDGEIIVQRAEELRSPQRSSYQRQDQIIDQGTEDFRSPQRPYQRQDHGIDQRAQEARSFQRDEFNGRVSIDPNRPRRSYPWQDNFMARNSQSFKEAYSVMERTSTPREIFLDTDDVAPQIKARTIQYEVVPPAKQFLPKEPPENSRFSRSSRASTDLFVQREIRRSMDRGRRESDVVGRSSQQMRMSRDYDQQQQPQLNILSQSDFYSPTQAGLSRDVSSSSRADAALKKHLDQAQDELTIKSNDTSLREPNQLVSSSKTDAAMKKQLDQAQDELTKKANDPNLNVQQNSAGQESRQNYSKQMLNQTVQKQSAQLTSYSHIQQQIGQVPSCGAHQRPDKLCNADNLSKRSEEVTETYEDSFAYKPSTPKLTLYYDIVSPQSRSCLMLICLLKLDVDLRYTNIFNGDQLTEEYLKINPVHTVPTLVSNDMTFTDSHTILMYLCDNSDNPLAKQLYPQSYVTRLKIMNCLFFEAQVLYRRHSNFMTDIVRKEFANIDYAFHEKKILEAYETLNSFLKDSNYLVGDSMTIADISIVATISALDLMFPIDQYQNVWPDLAKWFRTMRAIPMYRLNFAGVMKQGDLVEKIGKFEFPNKDVENP